MFILFLLLFYRFVAIETTFILEPPYINY